MKIFGARYEKGELHLKCEPPDGLKFVYGFKEGLYEILPQKKEKKHRSLDANAYAWVLIDQSATTSVDKLRFSMRTDAVLSTSSACSVPRIMTHHRWHGLLTAWFRMLRHSGSRRRTRRTSRACWTAGRRGSERDLGRYSRV